MSRGQCWDLDDFTILLPENKQCNQRIADQFFFFFYMFASVPIWKLSFQRSSICITLNSVLITALMPELKKGLSPATMGLWRLNLVQLSKRYFSTTAMKIWQHCNISTLNSDISKTVGGIKLKLGEDAVQIFPIFFFFFLVSS